MVRPALLFVLACAGTVAGCDGLLGINEHTLEEGGAPEDGGARDSESGAAPATDAPAGTAVDAGASG